MSLDRLLLCGRFVPASAETPTAATRPPIYVLVGYRWFGDDGWAADDVDEDEGR